MNAFDFGAEGPWPRDFERLEALQLRLARAARETGLWAPAAEGPLLTGAVFVCFPLGGTGSGARGDPGWAGAAASRAREIVAHTVVPGEAGAPYRPGLLAAREGPLLEAAVRALPMRPEVLLVNATGLDHPRRAGMAIHLGAALDLPTVGVTHRPLEAKGDWPGPARGAHTLLSLGGEPVGVWLRVRDGARPLAIHPGWGTDAETAVRVVLGATLGARTPRPLRAARQRAREARAVDQGRAVGPAGPLLPRD